MLQAGGGGGGGERWLVNACSLSPYPLETAPLSIVQETRSAPEPTWTDGEQKKIHCAHRVSITVLPGLQRVTIPTTPPMLVCVYVPQNSLLSEGCLLSNIRFETSLPLPALYSDTRLTSDPANEFFG